MAEQELQTKAKKASIRCFKLDAQKIKRPLITLTTCKVDPLENKT